MLQAPPASLPHRRGHAHKRSAAISGDFDLEFFKQGPSISQQLSTSAPSVTSPNPYLTPKTPNNTTFQVFTPPSFVVSEVDSTPNSIDNASTSTPSPKKHTRLNSWAHTLTKPKQPKDLDSTLEYSSSSSNENTPELKRQAVNYTHEKIPLSPPSLSSYKIPEAIIDLDLASGVYHDPSSNSNIPSIVKNRHRRTESAPELEDFLKYKIFSSTPSNKNSRRNSAIFEEEDEDEDLNEILSSTSSNNNVIIKNPSMNSLQSNSSNSKSNLILTPNSATRRGASAKRYQNYYNNNILLSNALKSSESLSNIIHNKSSSSSISTPLKNLQQNSINNNNNNNNNNNLPSSSASSSSSINSSITNSPSRFNFQSQVYDIPKSDPIQLSRSVESLIQKQSSSSSKKPYISNSSSSLKTKQNNLSKNNNNLKQHKKSNSLFSSISKKIRKNSNSSSSPKPIISKRSASDETPQKKQIDDDSFEGDSTLTPFNFGEPGPELDLITMTPRYHNSNSNNNSNNNSNVHKSSPSSTTTNITNVTSSSFNNNIKFNEHNEIFQLSSDLKNEPLNKETPKKNKKTFFPWRKK